MERMNRMVKSGNTSHEAKCLGTAAEEEEKAEERETWWNWKRKRELEEETKLDC